MERRTAMRWSCHDYREPGAYFVTVCTQQRRSLFGAIDFGEVKLNLYGLLVCQSWLEIPNHFPDVLLDASVVMPNHVHGIIFLHAHPEDPVGARHASPGNRVAKRARHASSLSDAERPAATHAPSLGAIIGAFKSAATRRINVRRRTPGAVVWQRDYYDRVVRDDDELNRIRQYIVDNPSCWDQDPENLQRRDRR